MGILIRKYGWVAFNTPNFTALIYNRKSKMGLDYKKI